MFAVTMYFYFAPLGRSHRNNKQHVPHPDRFITWNKEKLEFNLYNKTFFATGCNMPWMGLVISTSDIQIAESDVQCFTQPSKENITKMLTYARMKINCNVIRCHTLGFSSFAKNSFIPSVDQNINQKYWDIIDHIILTSRKLGLYLIPVFCDQYNGYNGNYGIFVANGETVEDFYDTKSKTFENYTTFLSTYLNHVIYDPSTKESTAIKDEPTIFCLEFGNELGDHSLTQPGQCSTPSTIQCQYGSEPRPVITIPPTKCLVPSERWMETVRDVIRSIDRNHMLMTGADWCQLRPPVESLSCEWDIDGIDIISFHWYFCRTISDTSFDNPSVLHIMTESCKPINRSKKAVLFGEYPANYAKVSGFLEAMSTLMKGSGTDGSPKLNGHLFWDLVYLRYISGGSDWQPDGCQPDGYAVAPSRDDTVLDSYAKSFSGFAFRPTPTPTDDTIQILLIGDSITAGFHCSGATFCGSCQTCDSINSCDFATTCRMVQNASLGAGSCKYIQNCSLSFADFLARYLTQKHSVNIEIYNNAIKGTTAFRPNDRCEQSQILYGGSYVEHSLKCWETSLTYSNIDFITIMFGTNDALIANITNCFGNDTASLTQAVISGLVFMIDQLKRRYPDAIIFLIRPIPSNSSALNLDVIHRTFRAMSDIQNVVYIDLYNILNRKIKNIDPYLCDMIHPFDHLNKIIGENIGEIMDQYIVNKSTVKDPQISIQKCVCDDDRV